MTQGQRAGELFERGKRGEIVSRRIIIFSLRVRCIIHQSILVRVQLIEYRLFVGNAEGFINTNLKQLGQLQFICIRSEDSWVGLK